MITVWLTPSAFPALAEQLALDNEADVWAYLCWARDVGLLCQN